MKITKKVQCAVMLCLYLSRYGRTCTEVVAEDLNVSQLFLSQVAGRLKREKILKSTMGPSGGYEMLGDPTVLEVMAAVSNYGLLNSNEIVTLSRGCKEQRSLLYFATNLNSAMNLVLKRKVRNLVNELDMIDRASGRTKEVVVNQAVSDKVN